MNIIRLLTLSIVFQLACFHVLNAQENTKWKKVSRSNFENPYEDEYPEASAIILYDEGIAKFEMYKEEFKLIYERYTRILILNKEGYDYANIEIAYYPYHEVEEIIGIDACTYNYDKGKILKAKLKNSEVYDEDINGKWHNKKFSMPAVKEGSVIEYRYTLVSDNFVGFRDWYFQHSIPTVYSKYTTRIPEYLRYSGIVKGTEQLDSKDIATYNDVLKFTVHENMSLTARTATGSLTTKKEHSYNEIRFEGTATTYIMKDVPPIKKEPYITCLEDYKTKVIHQLVMTEIPGGGTKPYMTDWGDMVNKLYNSDYFGGQLKGNNFLNKEVESITTDIDDPVEKMKVIYDHVRKTMKWDGFFGKYTNGSLKKAWEKQAGNGAEINLILTEMLDKAGLKSYPVILSTRDHGQLLQAFPVSNQFNHVINCTVIQGKTYLLDAKNSIRPYNLLAKNDLNGEGLITLRENPQWVKLKNNIDNKTVTNANINITDEGTIDVVLEELNQGYFALDERDEIFDSGEEDYINNEYGKNLDDIKIDTFYFENLKNIDVALKKNITLNTSSYVNQIGEMIYLQPMFTEAFEDNPFKKEERKIPVDFNYPREYFYIMNLTLPEGYDISELPQSVKYLLPDNGGEFLYHITRSGNNLQLISKFKINQVVYLPDSYPYLKELFDEIIAKQAEQIILTKTS